MSTTKPLDEKMLQEAISRIFESLSPLPTATKIQGKLCVVFAMAAMADMSDDMVDKVPMGKLFKMMHEISPELTNDMHSYELRALALFIAERFFAPGEIEKILEGRRATRDAVGTVN